MLGALVWITLLPCSHRLSAASSSPPPPGDGSSPWCVYPSSVGDLDPVSCSARCQDEGFQFAALSPVTCCCGNQLHALVISGCFNKSVSEETKNVRKRQSDEEQENVALFSSHGPFLENIRVSVFPGQEGRTFGVKASGNLAGLPTQHSGIMGFEEQHLPNVTVEFLEMTSKGQSSHHVKVSDDGSFSVSSGGMLETTGKFKINIHHAHSTLSFTLHLSASQLPPGGLVICLLQGPRGVHSCSPSAHGGSNGSPVEAAYLGDPVQLQVVVHPAVSDFKLNISDDRLTAGGDVSVEFFATMRHLLVLNLALQADFNHENGERHNLEKGCNHGNLINNHHVNQQRDSILLHLDIHCLLRACDPSSCHLHLHSHLFPGQRGLVASVFSLSGPPSVLISTIHPLMLNTFEPICPLNLSESCKSSLEVSHMGSRVIWASLVVTVWAFSPVSKASLCTQIWTLDVPSLVATNQKCWVSFTVTAGSNVTISLLVNATELYRNSSFTIRAEATAVWLFNHSGPVVIELQAENRVSPQSKHVRMCVERKRKPQDKINSSCEPSAACREEDKDVRIYAEKQAYPTNTDIIFKAMADVPDPVEFFWDFGDSGSARITSRTVTKRYQNPGSYDVLVVASWGWMVVTSDVFTIVVQRAVKLNRLVHQASVLQNQTFTISCRVNMGTDLTFRWSFGDGTTRSGQSTAQHVYHRSGEFTIKVTVSNLISSASLSSHIFVVDRPCQPPPVKNMGPLKLQVRRYEEVRLGVTFETDVHCDTSMGLNYTWTLFDSAGRIFPLHLTNTHRQNIILQSHLLQHGTYKAIAKVQVIGSVVYSNYTVRFHVMSSPPVAFIQGGTNIFIDKKSNNTITLDGRASYDPDFPLNPLSYSWRCKPVSTIVSSCFSQDVPTSSPELRFPISLLKHNFDQYQVTLTIHSGERSSSSETFLTLTSDTVGKVSVYCLQCQGDRVNWDQTFSVSAVCDDCNVPSETIQYTWSLYLVNASSKPVTEVPFCYEADLSAPSSIVENPATSTPTPRMFTAPSLFLETLSDGKSEKQNSDLGDSGAASNKSRVTSNTVDLSNSQFPTDPDSSADWEYYFPLLESGDIDDQPVNAESVDYGVPFPAEEGDPGMSAGRHKNIEHFSPGDGSMFNPALNPDEGSNLVDPKPSAVIQEQTLLDLQRDSVHRDLFESYTYTGISSFLLRFKPFSLKPKATYLLDVSAKFQNTLLGRTQLFFRTSPPPEGLACQVQPAEGMELHTHFSIFCTSGQEDLLYRYSFSVGSKSPRVLYQGRDFQYYFSLPSGDPSDDYKVTIYIEIRSGRFGSATKPCPVTVQVKPSFLRGPSSSSFHQNPELKLSESGLRNLSALVQLGNAAEIQNYVSLLSSILNRLSLDAEGDAHVQRHMRNVLICVMCEIERSNQISVKDNIFILNDLLQVTGQVTLVSVRRVTSHIQAVLEQFPEFTAPDFHLNQRMLYSLVSLLSYSLQVVTGWDYTPKTPNITNLTQALESDSPTDQNIKDSGNSPGHCITDSSSHPFKLEGVIPIKQVVDDILQTATDLMLRDLLFQESKENTVSAGFISLHAASQNQTSTTIRSSFTTIYIPASLMQTVFVGLSGRSQLREDQICVLRVLTELSQSPYSWASLPAQLSGPVVDFSLYKCSTRRRIRVHSLLQPISIELRHPQRNRSSVREFTLLRGRIDYHNFSINPDSHQAIRVTVVFTSPPIKTFPIMLLFRMFERPTPRMHHLRSFHKWESNTVHLTLLPSYLNAAGVGHLALLGADFEKVPRGKQKIDQISYSLTVDSSLCLSWDGQQGVWTSHGCRTQQTDTTQAVNCSCYQLRPVTVFQQQIQSHHETAALDPFLNVSRDVTVLCVLILFLVLCIPGLVWCKRVDESSEENRRVHHLSDNDPSDSYLYAVCIHTGLCSAARMTAKVYIVLCGELGVSQTKELHVPGCTMFRRNSRDTFLLSTANSLGSVWGVHIWHDNSGPSPDWYLKQVVVSEVRGGQVEGRWWMFVSECWLAANGGDGRVERMLCVRGISFAKMLFLNFSDLLADFHMWMSVSSCPCPNSFTHTQRLSVCLLLLLGYACANAVIVSLTDNQLPFDLGIIAVSADSITTGLLSVVIVLPAASVMSSMFRLCGNRLTGSGVQHGGRRKTKKDDLEDAFLVKDSEFESHLTLDDFEKWTQETRMSKYQDMDIQSVYTVLENKSTNGDPVIRSRLAKSNEDPLVFESSEGRPLHKVLLTSKESYGDQTPEGREAGLLTERFGSKKTTGVKGQIFQNKSGFRVASLWSRCLSWALCLLMSLLCLGMSAVLGMRFSSSKVLLWTQSLFVSLISCIFFIQPAVIFAGAIVVSFWHKNSFSLRRFQEGLNLWSHNDPDGLEEEFRTPDCPEKRCSHLEKLLRARQRARYLCLVRPPTPSDLRRTRGKKSREDLIHKTLRDLCFCAALLFLMMFISYGSSFREHYQLNRAVKRHFIGNHNFSSIKKHEDWWKWTQAGLLDLLFQNESNKTENPHVVIGDLIIKKTDKANTFQTLVALLTHPRTCDHMSCFSEKVTTVGLGHTKSEAALKLNLLRTSNWLGRRTVALKVQFTLYSPAPNLFTSVTLLTEQSPSGVLMLSAKVQSVRMYHSPTGCDWAVMVCQLLFFFLSLLQLCNQASTVAQQGLMGNWRTPSTWLDASRLTATLVYYVCCVHHSIMIMEVVNLLQKHNNRGHVDVSDLATQKQYIRSLCGIVLFLLTMKSVTLLRVNWTLSSSAAVFAHSVSSLLWPTISGLILLVALSCLGNLLYGQSSWAFSSVPRSLQTLLCYYRGLRPTRGLLPLLGQDFSPWGVLLLSASAAWSAMVIGAISLLVRSTKSSQSRMNIVTVRELFYYLKEKVSVITGQHRKIETDFHNEGRTFFLEELERLVDELLFRLDVLSDDVPHSNIEDSPDVSPSPQPTPLQNSLRSQTEVNKPQNEPDQRSLPYLFRYHNEQEIQNLPHQRSKMRNNYSDMFEETKDKLKMFQNSLVFPESTSLQKVDVLETGAEQWSEPQNSCCSTKTHSEVLVEVLVHKEMETEEQDV